MDVFLEMSELSFIIKEIEDKVTFFYITLSS